jgi:archaellum component FlaG (FlaF/FlaG flagellin family)
MNVMKTLVIMLVAGALSVVPHVRAQNEEKDKSVREKTSEAWDATKKKTKEAGNAVARVTKDTANAVVDAVTPDSDANKVDVTVAENSVDLPKSVDSGKTAFVVKNSGKEKHNFAVRGHGIDRKFLLSLDPGQTKVLHVDLKPGKYKASVLMTDHEDKEVDVTLKVR